jgi:hypothetical protein
MKFVEVEVKIFEMNLSEHRFLKQHKQVDQSVGCYVSDVSDVNDVSDVISDKVDLDCGNCLG